MQDRPPSVVPFAPPTCVVTRGSSEPELTSDCAGLFFWTDLDNSGYCSKKNITHTYVSSDFTNTDYSATLPGAVVDLKGKCKEWHTVGESTGCQVIVT